MHTLFESLETRVCFDAWTMLAENVVQSGLIAVGPDAFAGADGGAFYIGHDAKHGSELWYAGDGGGEGRARLVKDVRVGKKSSSIELLGASGRTLFFAADDGVTG